MTSQPGVELQVQPSLVKTPSPTSPPAIALISAAVTSEQGAANAELPFPAGVPAGVLVALAGATDAFPVLPAGARVATGVPFPPESSPPPRRQRDGERKNAEPE